MNAAKDGDAEVVKLLIEYGADVDAKDDDTDRTALMNAAKDGDAEVAALLREAGAKE